MSHRPLRWLGTLTLLAIPLLTGDADARPVAPGIVCETYPASPLCLGASPECATCHIKTQQPVVMNAFGEDVTNALAAYGDPPFDNDVFEAYLPFALTDIEALDSDGDGVDNLDELYEGTLPGDAQSLPQEIVCPEDVSELDYAICEYDPAFAYRKLAVDFCGVPPSFDEMEAYRKLDAASQHAERHAKLDGCLDDQFWQGFDGVLWEIAHDKIRPLSAFFSQNQNFFADYAMFVWTQIDGHDVRDMLVADYHVTIMTPNGEGDLSLLVYDRVEDLPGQPLQKDRRAGMMTLAWPLFYNTMFTALPRTTAAQAYRSFLGMDIARNEGLDWPVNGEPVDYDSSGVTEPECAQCHSTLDPLSYPFSRYNGLQADGVINTFEYDPARIDKYFLDQFPDMADMPEAGYIFGLPVANLSEWAQVAASSNAFYIARVKDYWRLLMGEDPRPDDPHGYEEFTLLWESLREHNSIETMLHELVETEAYGAP